MENFECTPFLKWAGGKRWLVYNYSDLIPKNFNNYIEPFLGGGAMFFHLRPKKAILSDINVELVNAYRSIRDDHSRVELELKKHQRKHSKYYYYQMRNKKFRANPRRAAQFIYLNRTCWNGLYRVNQQGEFNVPIGTKDNVLLSTDNFPQASGMLRKAKIFNMDFEPIILKARKGDLLFIDPPYTVKHNNNNFRKYNEKIFSWDDQKRLKKCIVSAKKRGVKIVICNADHQSIKELYKGVGRFHQLSRYSILSADSKKRQSTTELAILA